MRRRGGLPECCPLSRANLAGVGTAPGALRRRDPPPLGVLHPLQRVPGWGPGSPDGGGRLSVKSPVVFSAL